MTRKKIACFSCPLKDEAAINIDSSHNNMWNEFILQCGNKKNEILKMLRILENLFYLALCVAMVVIHSCYLIVVPLCIEDVFLYTDLYFFTSDSSLCNRKLYLYHCSFVIMVRFFAIENYKFLFFLMLHVFVRPTNTQVYFFFKCKSRSLV